MSTSYNSICPEKVYVGLPLDREQSDPVVIREVEEFAEPSRKAVPDCKTSIVVQAQRITYPSRVELPVEVSIFVRTGGSGRTFNLGRYKTDEEGRETFEKAVQELDQGYRLKLNRGSVELVPPKEQEPRI